MGQKKSQRSKKPQQSPPPPNPYAGMTPDQIRAAERSSYEKWQRGWLRGDPDLKPYVPYNPKIHNTPASPPKLSPDQARAAERIKYEQWYRNFLLGKSSSAGGGGPREGGMGQGGRLGGGLRDIDK